MTTDDYNFLLLTIIFFLGGLNLLQLSCRLYYSDRDKDGSWSYFWAIVGALCTIVGIGWSIMLIGEQCNKHLHLFWK